MQETKKKKKKKKPLPKFLKWEFWPYQIFYIPVYFLIVFHALRLRTLSYFTLVNPGMKLGGFSCYSKYDILRQLSFKFLPKTILFDHVPVMDEILASMNSHNLSFPIILKPDEGERGWKVEKAASQVLLENYLADAPGTIMLQEYVDLPEEYGIMYYRFPYSKSGVISSVMKREFLSVTGDGRSTLSELFHQSERCLYHLKRLNKKFCHELDAVPSLGEVRLLEEIGNHNRGTTFFDANHLICEELVQQFDHVSRSLYEWYFGRFDVRTRSFTDMLKGNFKVVEVNGVNSEPAHIYDPDMGILKAYRDLFRHWNTIFQISVQNKKRGYKATDAFEMIRMLRNHSKIKKKYPNSLI